MKVELDKPFVVISGAIRVDCFETFDDAEDVARGLVEGSGAVTYVARITARYRRCGVVREDVK